MIKDLELEDDYGDRLVVEVGATCAVAVTAMSGNDELLIELSEDHVLALRDWLDAWIAANA